MRHPHKSQSIIGWALDLPLTSAPAQIVSGRATAMMSTEQTQATMEAYIAALRKGEAYEAFFADDIVVTFVGTGQVVKGPAPAKQAIDRLLNGEFDAELAIRHLLVGPGLASHEAALLGAQLGKVARTPLNGRRVDIRHSVFYELADGKITALRVRWSERGPVWAPLGHPGIRRRHKR